MCPKGADGMANSVYPDQTDPSGADSDLGILCLPRPVCQKTNLAANLSHALLLW